MNTNNKGELLVSSPFYELINNYNSTQLKKLTTYELKELEIIVSDIKLEINFELLNRNL